MFCVGECNAVAMCFLVEALFLMRENGVGKANAFAVYGVDDESFRVGWYSDVDVTIGAKHNGGVFSERRAGDGRAGVDFENDRVGENGDHGEYLDSLDSMFLRASMSPACRCRAGKRSGIATKNSVRQTSHLRIVWHFRAM